ncbi:MAG: DUF2231 domain-containing protein [Opitutaceae bacterium]
MIELFGRVHPLLVHFPIALLLIAAGLEVWRLKAESLVVAHFVLLTSLLGAFFSAAAVATGWVFSNEFHRSDTAALLAQHRWLGFATLILAVVTAGVVWRWNRPPSNSQKWIRRLLVWATAAILVAAAHVGAMAVWGDDFFSG